MNKKILIAVLICVCLTLIAGTVIRYTSAAHISSTIRVSNNNQQSEKADESQMENAPVVSAKGAILIDASDGQIIFEKNADQKLYPASTTKIMTSLVVFDILGETQTDMDSCVIIPKEAVGVEGSSIYLKAGEKLTIRELMYGMMLQSGNDAAAALAICCGGSMENFIDRMNQKALELGCEGTHFVNPNGLYDENHYTTAEDLALISMEAMKNQEFRQIVQSEKWQSEKTDRVFVNKNKTISQYEGATGIKIGYTRLSGRTLVASAKRGQTELIAVALDDSNWFNDAYNMLDYGFSRQDVISKQS